jgi:bacillolysin
MRAIRLTAVAVVIAAGLGGQAVRADSGSTGGAPAALGAGPLAPSAASLAAERILRTAADAPVTVTRDLRGLAHLVGASAGHVVPLPEGVAATAPPAEQALAHLARLAPLFGLTDVARELELVPVPAGLEPGPGDDRAVRFQQLRDGQRVLGGQLVVALDPRGALRSVTGETVPGSLGPVSTPVVTADHAREAAIGVTARAHPDHAPGPLRASAPERWYLDPALLGVPASVHMPAGPVWRTEVTGPADVRELVLVDARTGTVPLHIDQVAHALDQVVCDRANAPDRVASGSDCKSPYARKNGAAATGKTEIDEAYDNTARTSTFYSSYLGVDLTKLLGVDTGDGKKLRSTVRFCPRTTLCSATQGTLFDNAFWNGRGMYYGTGWQKGDDIVAHELSHGLTEKTSNLLYLYQSGAINESMSDVFGEMTDLTDGYDAGGSQTPWVVGEDAPLDTFPLRNMADPTLTPVRPQPDRMTSPYYQVDVVFQDSGAVHDNSGVGNKAGYLIAVGTSQETTGTPGQFNGQTIQGIGIPKTATLYLKVETLLTSGADYGDLGGVLAQACANLVGKAGFTTDTCAQVRKAVVATEMTQQPTGLASAAAAPEAGYCPTGSRDGILTDGFEKFSKKRWTLGSRWAVIPDYAKEGRFSVYGVEPDFTTSSPITLNTAYTIPRKVKTYLRFAHQYRLDSGILTIGDLKIGPYYDGARLEYQIGSGSWTSATGLPWENGPRTRITPEGGSAYTAFGGDSRGYISSRVDLSSLAGKTIKLRWRIFGDKQQSFDGWTVDDVRLFACGGTTPSNVDGLSVKAGSKKVTVTWKEPLYAGGGITGYSVARTGASAVKVSKSRRSYTFAKLKAGKTYTFTVTPSAKGGAGPSSSKTAKAK